MKSFALVPVEERALYWRNDVLVTTSGLRQHTRRLLKNPARPRRREMGYGIRALRGGGGRRP